MTHPTRAGFYRKKPVVIEAFRFWGHHRSMWPDWFCEALDHGHIVESEPRIMQIHMKEGTVTAFAGDWIIKGVAGEIYPCKNEIFTQTYEWVAKTAAEAGAAAQVCQHGVRDPRACHVCTPGDGARSL